MNRWIGWGIVVALAILLVISGRRLGSGPGGERLAGVNGADTDAMIEVARPQMRDVDPRVPWVGRVISQASVPIIAHETGRVAAILIGDGRPVAARAELFTLGGPEVEQKRALLATQVQALAARAAEAQEIVGRKKESAAQQMISLDDLAAAQSNATQLAAALATARQESAAFEARTHVAAPVAGVFTRRAVAVGDDVAAGDALAEVVDVAAIRVEATVFAPPGINLAGAEAIVDTDAGAMRGVVAVVQPVRSAGGGVDVWIEGEALNHVLVPGMAARGEIIVETRRQILSIPVGAVVYDEAERPYVFLRQGATYNQTPVTLGAESAGWIEVIRGVAAEDEVVIRGAYELLTRNFSKSYQVPD